MAAYGVAAALFATLSVGFHLWRQRFATFAALIGLMVAPFFIALAFSA